MLLHQKLAAALSMQLSALKDLGTFEKHGRGLRSLGCISTKNKGFKRNRRMELAKRRKH